MHISQKGLDLIKEFEGFRNTSYQCAAGVWTIGYGTTRINGKPVTKGMKCDRKKAEQWLSEDVHWAERAVEKYNDKYNFNTNEFDALVSFCYNIGNIDGLTSNGTRDKLTIAEKMTQYCKAGGKTNIGLVERRKKEKELFLLPVTEKKTSHVQLNYQPKHSYTVKVESLVVRSKPFNIDGKCVLGRDLRIRLKKGEKVKNLATMRVCDQIFMYLGTTSDGTEKWACADNGNKAYIG